MTVTALPNLQEMAEETKKEREQLDSEIREIDILVKQTAGANRVEQLLIVMIGGEDDDAGIVPCRGQFARRLQPIEIGQVNIHQDHIRFELARLLDRDRSVSRFADDLQIILLL